MSTPTIDDEKHRTLGKEIYETKIKHLVEPQEHGKFLVLDITTGDYAIHPFSLGLATEQLRTKRPEAIVHSVRIGHEAVVRMRSPRKLLWGQKSDDSRKN